jgi:beta-glucosidase
LATDESIVLLKNDGNTLPLDRTKLKKIAVIGPWADQVLLDWYSGTPPYFVSIIDGIREGAGPGVKVLFDDGSDPAQAAAVAHSADVAIVVVGNHPECNAGWNVCPTPSNGKESVDRKTIALEQEELVKQIFAANPRTIEVLRASFPYAIVWSQQNLPAIVHITHNSQEEGHGLADVLIGDYSPAGRLTQTWPAGDAQLLPLMDYNLLHGRTYMYSKEKPLYAFGYGLSYTSFAYEALKLSDQNVKADGSVQVTVRVKNSGQRAGDEVVQMYVQHLGLDGKGSKVERPQLELKGFQRVQIEPGAEREVTLELKPRDLAYWDTASHVWRVEQEQVRVLAGGSSDRLPVEATLDVDSSGEITPVEMRELGEHDLKDSKLDGSANARPAGGNGDGKVFRVGGSISPPVVLKQPVAIFSDEARRAHFQGVCIVALIVDAQGNPQAVHVVRPLGKGLDEKAVEAVRKYRFKPAMKDGKTPVAVAVNVEVNFRLYERE